MRPLGHVVVATLSALTYVAALIPTLAVIILGAAGLARIAGDPAMIRATVGSVQAAGIVCAVGWPAGVLAALGIWGAPPTPRRVVIGAALLALFLAALPSRALDDAFAALLAASAAVAGVVLLVVTGALNTLDPQLLRTGAACGAAPIRAWRAVLASIAPALILAGATGFVLGLMLCAGLPSKPALAGLLQQATLNGDGEAAPEALMLALLVLAAVILAGLLTLPGRAFRRS